MIFKDQKIWPRGLQNLIEHPYRMNKSGGGRRRLRPSLVKQYLAQRISENLSLMWNIQKIQYVRSQVLECCTSSGNIHVTFRKSFTTTNIQKKYSLWKFWCKRPLWNELSSKVLRTASLFERNKKSKQLERAFEYKSNKINESDTILSKLIRFHMYFKMNPFRPSNASKFDWIRIKFCIPSFLGKVTFEPIFPMDCFKIHQQCIKHIPILSSSASFLSYRSLFRTFSILEILFELFMTNVLNRPLKKKSPGWNNRRKVSRQKSLKVISKSTSEGNYFLGFDFDFKYWLRSQFWFGFEPITSSNTSMARFQKLFLWCFAQAHLLTTSK